MTKVIEVYFCLDYVPGFLMTDVETEWRTTILTLLSRQKIHLINVNDPPTRVFAVCHNTEVYQVVSGVSMVPEGVDGVNPAELALVPAGPLQHGPPAHLLQHHLQGVQADLLDLLQVHAGLVHVPGHGEYSRLFLLRFLLEDVTKLDQQIITNEGKL